MTTIFIHPFLDYFIMYNRGCTGSPTHQVQHKSTLNHLVIELCSTNKLALPCHCQKICRVSQQSLRNEEKIVGELDRDIEGPNPMSRMVSAPWCKEEQDDLQQATGVGYHPCLVGYTPWIQLGPTLKLWVLGSFWCTTMHRRTTKNYLHTVAIVWR